MCVCVCVYVYIYVYIYLSIYVCVCMSICVCVCARACTYICEGGGRRGAVPAEAVRRELWWRGPGATTAGRCSTCKQINRSQKQNTRAWARCAVCDTTPRGSGEPGGSGRGECVRGAINNRAPHRSPHTHTPTENTTPDTKN